MYTDANGDKHFWEIKPISYRKQPKHDKAQTQLARYRALSQIKDPENTSSIGTQRGGPLPFVGSLTMPVTDGIRLYEVTFFVPKGEEKKGLIYYKYKDIGVSPALEKSVEVAKDVSDKLIKTAAVLGTAAATIALIPETGGASIPVGGAIMTTIITSPSIMTPSTPPATPPAN